MIQAMLQALIAWINYGADLPTVVALSGLFTLALVDYVIWRPRLRYDDRGRMTGYKDAA